MNRSFNYLKYIVLGLLLCGASFSIGAAVIQFQFPPYDIIQKAYRYYTSLTPPKLAEFTIDTGEISKELLNLTDNAEQARNGLIDRVILPKEMVTVTERDIGNDRFEIGVKIYGIKSKAILSKSTDNASCLRIYIQGHGGKPFAHEYHGELLESSVASGCDFLSMSMVGIGQNTGPADFPSGKYRSQITRLNWGETTRHGNYMLYHDNTMPEKDPLALFLTPHYYTIQSILPNYDEVSMMGISGGGWYTVWLAAIMPDVDYSIVYAGSLPRIYRTSLKFFGDYEEIASPLYNEIDYWGLYHLASQTTGLGGERKLFFVFNDKDPCCFMDPAASHFKAVSEELYEDNVEVIIDQHSEHEMKVSVIQSIWARVADLGYRSGKQN